jgi:hypothetical protein
MAAPHHPFPALTTLATRPKACVGKLAGNGARRAPVSMATRRNDRPRSRSSRPSKGTIGLGQPQPPDQENRTMHGGGTLPTDP